MAISATKCGFDKAGRPGASVVTVIGIFLGQKCLAPEPKTICFQNGKQTRMKMLEPVVPYLVESEAPRAFKAKKPDDPGWLAPVRKPATNACLRVLTPSSATIQ
jgi:hypothetical protein